MEPREDLQSQLQRVLAECASLREENRRLKELLGLSSQDVVPTLKAAISETPIPYTTVPPPVANDSPIEAQVALFRSLFRGREDVYPVRWEGKRGNSGYSPACANEWSRPTCQKPKIRCSDCKKRKLLPVTDEVIRAHLLGKRTIGVYPLLLDEVSWFLAVDFDKKTWQEDILAFLGICHEMGIPAALERSRSGQGGHIWINGVCTSWNWIPHVV